MPNDTIDDALREAYAVCPGDALILETLEISHPSQESIYIVRDRAGHTLALETGEYVYFEPVGFGLVLPSSSDEGLQEIVVAVDDVNRRASDFADLVKASADPVIIRYRPYLASDASSPKVDPVLSLKVKSFMTRGVEFVFRASFADLVNRSFPNLYFTKELFPGLV